MGTFGATSQTPTQTSNTFNTGMAWLGVGQQIGNAYLTYQATKYQIQGIKNAAAAEAMAYKSQTEAFEFNKKLLGIQARIAEEQVEIVDIIGDLNIRRIREEGKALTSSQIAAYAKSGVELSGSPLQVIEASIKERELDVLIERYNIETDKINLRAQAANLRTEALFSGAAATRSTAAGFRAVASGQARSAAVILTNTPLMINSIYAAGESIARLSKARDTQKVDLFAKKT